MTTQRQSTSGGLPSAVKPDDLDSTGTRRARSWGLRVVVVLVGALAASVCGTALHGQTVAGFPIGAVAALVLSGSIAVFVGTCFRSVWPTAAVGVLTYALTGMAATLGGASSLIVSGSTGMSVAPIAVAGNVWIFGQAVVGILTVVLVTLSLKNRRKPAS
ncbi:hypothetical protein [Arthrobacter roseus]|uniref:hypothetical protein n=1 Tax=Arthrobacter roseus TaxID=136274 RepID=UPI001964677C|nr:hypothetical protein [Arthrobacter roseus]MBM7849205.1 N-acetyl-1-D-myo-inositol-2-amino-2-deoxy-alpha-D-glucopyranoside deacetylase [Arthrobacter roseus]